MALDDKLGNLPPLSLEQERTLSTQELRVYVEARYWQAYYDSPRTLEQAQREYIQQTIPSFEESIGRMKEALSSGTVPEDFLTGWKENIAEQQQKLDALKRGSVSFVAD
jgi:hypothetical protein